MLHERNRNDTRIKPRTNYDTAVRTLKHSSMPPHVVCIPGNLVNDGELFFGVNGAIYNYNYFFSPTI